MLVIPHFLFLRRLALQVLAALLIFVIFYLNAYKTNILLFPEAGWLYSD